MPSLTIQQAFDLAFQHHQAGQLQEAEQLYRQILSRQPKHADALHFLGLLAHQAGSQDVAMELLQKSISLGPTVTLYHNNMGNVLQAQGRLDEAIACYRRVLTIAPENAEAHYNLGNAFAAQKRIDDAIASYQHALAINSNLTEAHYNLGNTFAGQDRFDDAIVSYQKALVTNPNYARAHHNLGNAFATLERSGKGIVGNEQGLASQPKEPEAHGRETSLTGWGRFDDAIACYQRALAILPNYAQAHCNMGTALMGQGHLDDAIASYERALAILPNYAEACSNLMYTLLYHPSYDNAAISKELQRWQRQFAEPLKKFILPHSNGRDPERKLRIGYVSPDLREHPVGRFLLPVVKHHDQQCIELFFYAKITRSDGLTEQFRFLVDEDHWRPTIGLSDAQVAEQICKDQIDILIDLAMHTAGTCLLTFARKPAPVQATWLAYPGSTGLETMDYRVSDPHLDPPEVENTFYSEETIRLPETYWCYQPTGKEPEVNPLPAEEKGFVTFGCLNTFSKVSEPTIATWGRILQAVPQSRLVLHAPAGSCRQRVVSGMEQCGIEAQRIRFVEKKPANEYFGQYHDIDIALDPFPYGGGTTTCDALWMGVPVVSLAGQTAVGRGGLSILSNIGLPELVGHTAEEYIQIAVNLAGDLPRLAELRGTLRQRMQASPLMDAPRFACNMEAAYRTMWRKWCGASSEQVRQTTP